MADMGKLIEEMTRAGVLLDTAGLRPTSDSTRVRLRNGKLSTTDGPFTETKEVIGGFALLEAGSKEEAIEHTKRVPAIHGDEWNLECEGAPTGGSGRGMRPGLMPRPCAVARVWPSALPGPIALCVQHDPVSRLARAQVVQRIVDAAHREVLGLRRDAVARGEIQHRADAAARTGGRAGHTFLPGDHG
jgi:hypothetical protein